MSDSAIVVFDAANGNYLDRIPLKRIAISFCKFAENVEGEYFFWSYSKNSIYVKDGENMYPIKKRSGYPLACYSFYRNVSLIAISTEFGKIYALDKLR